MEERTLSWSFFEAILTLIPKRNISQKRKTQANISDKYGCKNKWSINKNTLKPRIHYKDHASWSSEIYSRDTKILCVLPVVQVPGRERRLLETMQLAIGEFITDWSQGLPPSPRVWGRKALSPSSLRYLLGTIISWHKWIGYTVGSWHKQIGYTIARQFLLAQRGAFSFPLIGSLFSC